MIQKFLQLFFWQIWTWHWLEYCLVQSFVDDFEEIKYLYAGPSSLWRVNRRLLILSTLRRLWSGQSWATEWQVRTSVMFWLSPTRPGIICLHNQLFSLIAVFTTGHLWSASVCVKITHHTTVKHKPDQNWARQEDRNITKYSYGVASVRSTALCLL